MLPTPHITCHVQDGVVVLRPVGEFDLASVDVVRAELLRALEQSDRIVLDLVETLFIDSTVLGAIVGASRRATDQGGWVRLAAARPNVHRVLRITELESVLGLYDGAQDAIDARREQDAPVAG